MMSAIIDQTLLTAVFERSAVKEPLPFEPFQFSPPFISNLFFLACLVTLPMGVFTVKSNSDIDFIS